MHSRSLLPLHLAHDPCSLGTALPTSVHARPHQTWLYDLAGYGLYVLLGGPGLVLCKALLVACLALLMLRLSKAIAKKGTGPLNSRGPVPFFALGDEWWLPALCTMLAVLAMSPRLLVQPATVSYLFLALTLWLLRPREIGGSLTGESSHTVS